MTEGEFFGVSILSERQGWLATQFATSGIDRFESVTLRAEGSERPPLIDGALVHLQCRRHATHDAGDHTIVVGLVLDGSVAAGPPLVHFVRHFGGFAPAVGTVARAEGEAPKNSMTFPASYDRLLAYLLEAHRAWEALWPASPIEPSVGLDPAMLEVPIQELARRLRENYPHFHPLYAGQMLKPPHPAAVLGYFAAMLVNPNNHALDGGRATARMEKEVIAELAAMVGYTSDRFLGHLTGGGTMANLEALWVARELHPERPVVFTTAAHYTHKRMCGVLRMPYIELPATAEGKLDVRALDDLLAERVVRAPSS